MGKGWGALAAVAAAWVVALSVTAVVLTVTGMAAGPGPRAPGPSSASALAISHEALAAATVRVESRGGGAFDRGTGVAIGPRLVMTSRHLVDQRAVFATWCEVHTLDVDRVLWAAGADLAFLEVTGRALPAVPLASDDPPAGTRLTLPGYPNGGPFAVAEVRVVDYIDGAADGEGGRILRFTPTPEVGHSGAPLLDGSGRVVALAYALEEASGFGHAIPASELRDQLDATLKTRPDATVDTSDTSDAAWARTAVCR